LIIALDAEEDETFTFGGLGNAVRKCRDDFGVEIVLNPQRIALRDDRRRSQAHFAIGRIHYPELEDPGWILYIKSSLANDEEPVDIGEYAAREAQFPHQSTADQFFDESQFESYRRLGQHIANVLLAGIPPASQLDNGATPFIDWLHSKYGEPGGHAG
jgi:hypothetical protein